MNKPTQFNWRRHWRKRVVPHLDKECVQCWLEFGMQLLNRSWRCGDPPYLLGDGAQDTGEVQPGTLRWYQPVMRCHWIAFFSLAIGALNYPRLDWQVVTGDLHTVPVGYGPDGSPRVVMDILLFDAMTAGESIAHAQRKRNGGDDKRGKAIRRGWEELFRMAVASIGRDNQVGGAGTHEAAQPAFSGLPATGEGQKPPRGTLPRSGTSVPKHPKNVPLRENTAFSRRETFGVVPLR
jgi:hypothetical protein